MTFPWWTGALVLTAWSLGIVVAVLLHPSLAAGLGGALLVGLAVTWVRPAATWPTLAAAAALVLGLLRGGLSIAPELAPSMVGQAVTIAGQVDDDPVQPRHGNRLVVRVPAMHTRVLATVYGSQAVHYGDLVLLTGRLEPAPRFETFDYASYLADHGISAILQSPHLVRVVSHPGDPLHAAIFALRHGLVSGIDRALPEPQAALLLGVVFGYRRALPHVLEQQMITSGLIHIVVISGLKVSLLARIVHQGMGRFAPGMAPAVALAAMITYALVSGASAAAIRAAAMGGLVVLAGVLRRDTHVALSMAVSAAAMLGLDPWLARDVSFQLSFVGTLGIAGFTDGIAARLLFIPQLLRDPFAATLAAEAATWPLMLASFHQVSLVAPVANALVLPLLPAVMVVGGAGAIVAALWQAAGGPCLQLAGLIITWFQRVIEVTAAVPGASLVTPYFPPRWIAAAALINGSGLAAVRLRRLFWQRRVWAGLGGLAVIAGALLLVQPDGRAHVYALDVGTGSGVLIRTSGGQQILFDSGPDANRFTQAIGRALPPTARSLKLWVITGGRREQIGAGQAVLDRFHVDRLVLADPDPWTTTLRRLIDQAMSMRIPVEMSAGGHQVDGVVMVPVDEQGGWLIRAGQAEVALLPPGSESSPSSTVIFVNGGPQTWDAVPPRLAVLEVSAQSRDGLPARALLDALRSSRVLRTDRLGSVELVSNGTSFTTP